MKFDKVLGSETLGDGDNTYVTITKDLDGKVVSIRELNEYLNKYWFPLVEAMLPVLSHSLLVATEIGDDVMKATSGPGDFARRIGMIRGSAEPQGVSKQMVVEATALIRSVKVKNLWMMGIAGVNKEARSLADFATPAEIEYTQLNALGAAGDQVSSFVLLLPSADFQSMIEPFKEYYTTE